jgi:multimeric flavodoxin WrbA
MKVVAINGSPRKDGNTAHALKIVGECLLKQGIELEIIQVGDKTIRGCIACGTCAKNKDERCSHTSDCVNDSIQIMKEADGIVIGSPVHYSGVGGTMKSFLDRAFYVSGCNGGLFRHKVGAAVTAVRRSGGSSALDCLNHYLMYSEMIVASANYWNIVHGRTPGEMLQDLEGVQTLEVLGNNMAWLLKMREETKESIPAPERVNKVYTHFIR